MTAFMFESAMPCSENKTKYLFKAPTVHHNLSAPCMKGPEKVCWLVVGVVNMLRIIFGVALSAHSFVCFFCLYTGCPKKRVFLGKSSLTGLGRGLEIKVG